MAQLDLYVPIRSFRGLTRLDKLLDPDERSLLSQSLCAGVIAAARGANLPVTIVTSDAEVADWSAERGVRTLADSGSGLSEAASRAARDARDRWAIVHADLPLITSEALHAVPVIGEPVLVPSLDGGTNIISASGAFPFSYGPGSFHRHLAATRGATIITAPELMIDLDTVSQLRALQRLAPTLVDV